MQVLLNIATGAGLGVIVMTPVIIGVTVVEIRASRAYRRRVARREP